mgnify:CR=1 FL=1
MCLLPNLGASGFKMDAWVVRVSKLIQHQTFAIGLHLFCQVPCALHASGFGGEYEFSTKGFHGLRPLDGQVLGHDEHHAVAHDGCGHGQSNAGIARGRLNQHRLAGRNGTRRFQCLDHFFQGRCLCLLVLGLCLSLRARSRRPSVVGPNTFAGSLVGSLVGCFKVQFDLH